MTRQLLAALAESSFSPIFRVVATLLVLALLPATVSIDVVAAVLSRRDVARVRALRIYRCSRCGHGVPADGDVECPSCGLPSRMASIFADGCRYCSAPPIDAVLCPCGAAVRNPLAEPL